MKCLVPLQCSVLGIILIFFSCLLGSGAVGVLYTPAMLVTVGSLGRLDGLVVVTISRCPALDNSAKTC